VGAAEMKERVWEDSGRREIEVGWGVETDIEHI
jgi:hypothetical protein